MFLLISENSTSLSLILGFVWPFQCTLVKDNKKSFVPRGWRFMSLICPVILCGGKGTRLWPLSRRSMPKQFLNLTGEGSLFQQAAIRVSGPAFTNPLVITANDYRFIAAQQMADIGIESRSVLLEPSAKNTAPAILAAAEKVHDEDPNALVLVVASDHYIPNQTAFIDRVMAARPFAEAGQVVIFGVQPDRPETGYGYIETGKSLSETDVFVVERFHEKPDLDTAKKMIEQGGYLWNSGIFLMKSKTVLELAERHIPNMLNSVRQSLNQGKLDLDFLRLEEKSWASIQSISIDYALIEKTDNLVVFSFLERWSDLGDWQAVMRELSADSRSDSEGNLLVGKASQLESKSCLVWSESPEQVVMAVGLKDVIVVAMGDAVLVLDKDKSQSVKEIVDLLDQKKFSQAYEQRRQFRPWGWFETLVLADRYQVRRVHLYPQTKMSLQTHQRRFENWVVTSGTAEVKVGENLISLSQNESLDIPAGTAHQLSNPANETLTLIEVTTGSYLGEDDIERL